MTATHHARVKRLERLEGILPLGAAPARCLDAAQILEMLGDDYGEGDRTARLRALQRDLKDLLDDGHIEVVNRGGKPLRYRRTKGDVDDGPGMWDYTVRHISALVAQALPKRQLDHLWQRLINDDQGPQLDEARLRIVPDTLRLRPVGLNPKVLTAVIEALSRRCILEVDYRDSLAVRGRARLHPQALVQRGPIPYLFALKNDETEPVRFYAVHRMIRAKALPDVPAREVVGFDLDQAIAEGRVDFGQGEMIDLKLRVRGYLTDLLSVCTLAANQTMEDEPPGSDFEFRLEARVPSTGQLLRWLLGAGDNVEVVAPPDLRHVVAVQAVKMAAIYSAD